MKAIRAARLGHGLTVRRAVTAFPDLERHVEQPLLTNVPSIMDLARELSVSAAEADLLSALPAGPKSDNQLNKNLMYLKV